MLMFSCSASRSLLTLRSRLPLASSFSARAIWLALIARVRLEPLRCRASSWGEVQELSDSALPPNDTEAYTQMLGRPGRRPSGMGHPSWGSETAATRMPKWGQSSAVKWSEVIIIHTAPLGDRSISNDWLAHANVWNRPS